MRSESRATFGNARGSVHNRIPPGQEIAEIRKA